MPSRRRHYLIIQCDNCSRFLLAASDKKTRTCPYCGKRGLLENAKVVARSEDAEEARTFLQEVKLRESKGKAAK